MGDFIVADLSKLYNNKEKCWADSGTSGAVGPVLARRQREQFPRTPGADATERKLLCIAGVAAERRDIQVRGWSPPHSEWNKRLHILHGNPVSDDEQLQTEVETPLEWTCPLCESWHRHVSSPMAAPDQKWTSCGHFRGWLCRSLGCPTHSHASSLGLWASSGSMPEVEEEEEALGEQLW